MDRRQQKTRRAIFAALASLLERKEFDRITIQELIDEADVGRSTFYAHFETKEELLHSICNELLEHIVQAADDVSHTHGLKKADEHPLSVFCHSLQHLQENDHSMLRLLACSSNRIFIGYFSKAVEEIVRSQLPVREAAVRRGVPEEYLVHHITRSYLALVEWWMQAPGKHTAQELDRYFRAVTEPVLA